MKVHTKEYDDAVVISLTKEMMIGYEAQDFHDAISGSLEKNKKKIVIDLSNLKYISSWGIGILIHGYTTVNNLEGKFVLAAVPEIVNDALVKTKLDTIFHKCDSVEDALKSQDQFKSFPNNFPIVIAGRAVIPDSSAEKSGLAKGDVIVKFDAKMVKNLKDYSNLLKKHQPGDVVIIEYVKDGERKEAKLTLVER